MKSGRARSRNYLAVQILTVPPVSNEASQRPSGENSTEKTGAFGLEGRDNPELLTQYGTGASRQSWINLGDLLKLSDCLKEWFGWETQPSKYMILNVLSTRDEGRRRPMIPWSIEG